MSDYDNTCPVGLREDRRVVMLLLLMTWIVTQTMPPRNSPSHGCVSSRLKGSISGVVDDWSELRRPEFRAVAND